MTERSLQPADAPTRVCLVLPAHWTAGMGGSEYQAKLLIEHLHEHYDAQLYYVTTAAGGHYRGHGYELVRFAGRGGLRRYGTFFDVLALMRALRRISPHVIYQQVGCAHTGIAAWYARLHGCRMVWRVSSDRHASQAPIAWWRPHQRLERWMLEQGIRRADLVLAQTEAQRTSLRTTYGCRNVVVVPNFHLPPSPKAAVRAFRKRVVWIANVKRLKNPLAFVRLARRLRDRTDAEFVAAGAVQEPAVGAELLAAAEGLPSFRFLGACTQEECEALLDDAAVLVNTSDYEGFPNTFIQAWLRRVPVVSLSVDPDGLLSRGGLGFLAHTEERLAVQVGRLLDDRSLAQRIGARCRAYATARHSMANADRVAELLGLRRRNRAGQVSAALAERRLSVGEGAA